MQRKPVTVSEVESVIENVRKVIEIRERAFKLISSMAERITPEAFLQPAMLEKLRQFAEIGAELQAQDASMALFGAKYAESISPTKPN